MKNGEKQYLQIVNVKASSKEEFDGNIFLFFLFLFIFFIFFFK